MPTTDELIGTTLRNIREEKQYLLRFVSSKAYVSLGFLSEIERGVKSPSGSMLDTIVTRGLGLTLSEFYAIVAENAKQTS